MSGLPLHKYRLFALDRRRGQERPILIVPIELYWVAMNRPGADRSSLGWLLRAAGAESGADLPPLSPSYGPVLGAADGLKAHGSARRRCWLSLVAAGWPGLSAGLVPTVTGRAQVVGALGWGRASFNKAYTQSGSAASQGM